MKRYVLSAVMLLSAILSYSQSITDITKYDTDIMGTARYMSMAGSMGVLGGDPSAVLDNPAGLGIYRSSELSFTLNASPSMTFATTSSATKTARDFFFNFNQISYVLSVQTGRDKGYVSSNFSFTYNRLKDFHRQIAVGTTSETPSLAGMIADFTAGLYPSEILPENNIVPYISVLGYQGYIIDPLDPDSDSYLPYSDKAAKMGYRGIESGRIDEYNFTYAANIGHYLYIGAGIGLQTLNYYVRSYNGEMYDNGANVSINNSFSTSGIGALLNVGIIARPFPFLRLGLSLKTPTWFAMNDSFYGAVAADGTSTEGSVKYELPSSGSVYGFNSPLKVQASVGFVLGKVGLINFDYQYTDNKGMRLYDSSSSSIENIFSTDAFAFENEEIAQKALSSHLFKLGAEVRLASQFSIRAGVAYKTPNIAENVTRNLLDNTTRTDMEYFVNRGSLYASGGIGYRYNGFGLDLTYAYSQTNQEFAPFQENAVLLGNGYFGLPDNANMIPKRLADIKTVHHNVVLTLLYKF